MTPAVAPGGYVRLRGSAVAGDRSLVMRTYWDNHRRFENTLAVLLSGEMITADDALRIGLVQKVTEPTLIVSPDLKTIEV